MRPFESESEPLFDSVRSNLHAVLAQVVLWCHRVVESRFLAREWSSDARQRAGGPASRKRKARIDPELAVAPSTGQGTAGRKVYLEHLFLRSYLAECRRRLGHTTSLHLATDASRVGQENTEFIAMHSPAERIAAWAPIQAARLSALATCNAFSAQAANHVFGRC